MIQEFIQNYGMEILATILTTISGYVGICVKNIYKKYVNTKTKKEVVKTVVNAIEQLYKNLNGEEKLELAIENATDMLDEQGISTSELEIRMLIESTVNSFNISLK